MKNNLIVALITLLICFFNCNSKEQLKSIKLGIDVLIEDKMDLIAGKQVGVITNQTGVDSKGNHIIDLVYESPVAELTALFCPEHGIRGDVEGGFSVDNNIDKKTGAPIFSIYGKTKKPTPEMLKGIDILIFDIQDIGTRFYTYISTMSLCMEAAAENNIKFIVLDRPNPINGTMVEGPVLDVKYRSFVGIQPIALRHGLTVGELANMFNEEGWLANGVRTDLTIIKMKNWKRESIYDELGLNWIKPSPNMPSVSTALLYPGLGLLETCNVSEGRGTTKPFKNIGAPWLNNIALKKMLEQSDFPGIKMDTISYIPVDMPGAAMNPKFEGERCKGLNFEITDGHIFPSVKFGVNLIFNIKKLHPDNFKWKSERRMSIMFGNEVTPHAMDKTDSIEKVIQTYQAELAKFKNIRKKYLLYE